MKEYTIKLKIAGVLIAVRSEFEDLENYFTRYISDENADEVIVQSDQNLVLEWKNIYGSYNSYAEYNTLHVSVSEALMKHNRFLFHSAAVTVNEKAWLLCGESGVGKTTQYKNLKKLYPDHINIISGDKPALEIDEAGKILVHPSPWNGKENYYGNTVSELHGIIVLKQEKENHIRKLNSKESILPVFTGIIQVFNHEELIKSAAEFADYMIRHIPIFMLENKGDEASSKLLYQTIQMEMTNEIQT